MKGATVMTHTHRNVPTIADRVPVTEIMTREVTTASRALDRDAIAGLMVRNHIGCIPVVEDVGRPVGMITKLDLVEQALATALAPATAEDLMMPLALTLGERATVAHAAAMMASEDIHHVPICDDTGRLVGIVSSMDIVRWLAKNDGFCATGT